MTDKAGASLIIDLDALAHNYALIRDTARGAETAPVVKADGYGLGAGPVARRLWAEGARTFFVARLSEGVALRRELADRQAAVLVFDGLTDEPGRYRDANLTPVLNTVEQVRLWDGRAPFALHIDTGMNRLGVTPDEAKALARDGCSPALVMSHLACGSEYRHPMNGRQLAAFREGRELFPNARASLANSAGVFLGPDYHFDLVRPGVSLYGGGPFSNLPAPQVRPVAIFHAPILQIRDVPAGETVGYGAEWTAQQPSRIAILAAGYADGILRAANFYAWRNPGIYEDDPEMTLSWVQPPYVGRVSMDMIALDVTASPRLKPGDKLELLGLNARLDDLAQAAGTIPYEILTRLSARAERTYLGDGA